MPDIVLKKKDSFYGNDTHASYQPQEESVKISGDGFGDSYLPKSPKTDSFMKRNIVK